MKTTTFKRAIIVMAMMLVTAATSWAYDFSVNGIYYGKSSDGKTVYVTYKTTSYNSYSGSVVIPSTVTYSGTTYSVTSIGNSAFESCSGLTSVTIPNSVTLIGADAFESCSGLTSVTIPNSVTLIGADAFNGCSGLTSVTIPNSVTSIGDYSFANCSKLTSVTIGNRVTLIDQYAFKGCSGLTSVTIPNSVTLIGEYAFSGCSGLTSVVFNAENCTTMGSYGSPVFYGCSNLTSLTIGANVKTIPSYAFSGCSGLTSMTIPNSVSEIGGYAFYECSGLTSVTIGNSVTSIGSYAFYNCSGLKELTIQDGTSTLSLGHNFDSSSDVGEGLFYDAPLESVYLGRNLSYDTSYRRGYSPFFDKSTIKELTIGNTVTSIGERAFYYCSGLTSVTFGNSVTSIGKYAFYGTAWYNNQPDGLVYAGKVAYKYKGTMPVNTSITIKDGTLGIAGGAFEDCSGLTDLTIGSSVNYIGASAFDIARLGRIKVLNPVPPTCVDNTVFKSVDKENCLLTVPHGTIDLYSTTYVWWDFKRMKEDNGQGDIATIDSDSVSVTAAGGAIRVEGAEDAEAEVYSLSGALLYRGTDSTIALPRGIYIVKVTGTTTKVIL